MRTTGSNMRTEAKAAQKCFKVLKSKVTILRCSIVKLLIPSLSRVPDEHEENLKFPFPPNSFRLLRESNCFGVLFGFLRKSLFSKAALIRKIHKLETQT